MLLALVALVAFWLLIWRVRPKFVYTFEKARRISGTDRRAARAASPSLSDQAGPRDGANARVRSWALLERDHNSMIINAYLITERVSAARVRVFGTRPGRLMVTACRFRRGT